MKERPFIYIFLPLWILLCFWQAYFAQLLPDEAYYWLYSQNLAWGYFDHPPAIAVLIKAGTLLFSNEWGVRFGVVVLSTVTLWLIYKIAEPENEWLFITIIACIVPLHLLVSFAEPDVPLMFFAALFFYGLKNYLQSKSRFNVLLLLIATVGMFYSKYHAVLVVVFTLLAAPVIFTFSSFYLVVLLSAGLYTPHIWWQFQHHFKTIKYQLTERSADRYLVQFTLDYLAGQLLMLGPVAAPFLVYASLKYKAANLFERVLLFNLVGFLIFFLLMSLRGHIEPNWTAPIWIPLIILSYRYFEKNDGLLKWLKPIAAISLIVILIGKWWLTFPVNDKKWFAFDNFHGWRKWAAAIKEQAQGHPVVFMNTYQFPAEYIFYAHQPSFSHNTSYSRSNQFDYWHYEEAMIGKKVMLVPIDWFMPTSNAFPAFRDTVKYMWVDNYLNFSKIRFRVLNLPPAVKANSNFSIHAVSENFFNDKSLTNQLTATKLWVGYTYTAPAFWTYPMYADRSFNANNVGDTLLLHITAPAKPGKYLFTLCLNDSTGKIIFSANSDKMQLKVED